MLTKMVSHFIQYSKKFNSNLFSKQFLFYFFNFILTITLLYSSLIGFTMHDKPNFAVNTYSWSDTIITRLAICKKRVFLKSLANKVKLLLNKKRLHYVLLNKLLEHVQYATLSWLSISIDFVFFIDLYLF